LSFHVLPRDWCPAHPDHLDPLAWPWLAAYRFPDMKFIAASISARCPAHHILPYPAISCRTYHPQSPFASGASPRQTPPDLQPAFCPNLANGGQWTDVKFSITFNLGFMSSTSATHTLLRRISSCHLGREFLGQVATATTATIAQRVTYPTTNNKRIFFRSLHDCNIASPFLNETSRENMN
jgi:hypothetical protein